MEGQVAETEKKTASKKTEAKKEASPAKAKQEKESTFRGGEDFGKTFREG